MIQKKLHMAIKILVLGEIFSGLMKQMLKSFAIMTIVMFRRK